MKLFGKTLSFGEQMTVLGVGVIVAVALGAGLSITIVADRQISDYMVKQGAALVDGIAGEAAFVLVVGPENPDEVETFIKDMDRMSGVTWVDLYSANGEQLTAGSNSRNHESLISMLETSSGSQLVSSTSERWIFAKTVTSGDRNEEQILGYVTAGIERKASQDLVEKLVFYSILSLFVFSLFGVMIMRNRVSLVTKPLRTAAAKMEEAQTAREIRLNASGDIPPELKRVGRVFNRLMDKQSEHEGSLERKVNMRTSELRIASQKAQDAERYKAAFMANVSHELKTPLNVINGLIGEIISEEEYYDKPNQTIQDDLASILGQTDSMLFRINQILDIAKLESGITESKKEDVCLTDLAAALSAQFRTTAKEGANSFSIKSIGDDSISIDGEKLAQICSNLISNALKFTRNGNVCMNILALDSLLKIKITDNGYGMTEAMVKKVFEPFEKDELVLPIKNIGSGLGMAIVNSHVESMGGKINVQSEKGRGTCIEIEIELIETNLINRLIRENVNA